MENMIDLIEKVARASICPKCGAQPGEDCVSRTGGKTSTHVARTELAQRLWSTGYMQGGMDRLTDVITNNGAQVERTRELLRLVMDDEGLPERWDDPTWFFLLVGALGTMSSNIRAYGGEGSLRAIDSLGVEYSRENLILLMRLSWNWLEAVHEHWLSLADEPDVDVDDDFPEDGADTAAAVDMASEAAEDRPDTGTFEEMDDRDGKPTPEEA